LVITNQNVKARDDLKAAYKVPFNERILHQIMLAAGPEVQMAG
jgi:hypothetical protein